MNKDFFKGLPVVFAPNWDNPGIKGKGTFAPKYVLLHHTAGVGTGVVPDIIKNSGYKNPLPIPKANFVVKRDGTLHVVSKYKTYHAGGGVAYKDVPANEMNSYSYGIEIESMGKVPDLTLEQFKTTAELTARLLKYMKKPVTNAINHKTWRKQKPDTLYSDKFWQDKIKAAMTPTPVPVPPVVTPPKPTPTGDTVYVYTGKPKENQTLTTKFTAVTDAHYTPKRGGILNSLLYIHVDYKLKPGFETGTIRVRVVRDKKTDDPSAYQDYTVSKHNPDFLITAKWFENCEAGVPLYWEVKVSNEFAQAVGTTRYSKWYM